MEEKSVSKFVIIGYGRTRSTLLSDLFNNHPHIGCEEEIFLEEFFSEGRVKFISNQYIEKGSDSLDQKELLSFRQKDPIGFMEYFFSLLAQKKQVVGFKLFPEQNELALDHVLNNRKLKKIILVRNFLFSHISVKQSLESKKWFTRKGEKSEKKDQPLTKFYIKPFLKYLKRRINALHRIIGELEETGQDYFLCFSEDIGKEEWRKDIYNFLGVELNIKTETKLVKQNPNYLQERVSNYDQMVQELMYTDFYHLLFGDFFPDRRNWLPEAFPEDFDPEVYIYQHSQPISNQNTILKNELEELRKKADGFEKESSVLRSSISYKIGNGLVSIPAAIFSIFRPKR